VGTEQTGGYVTDRVLLSANRANMPGCIELALQQDLGIEIMTFANPSVLDGDWRELVESYKTMLRPIRGLLTLHGPFMDMAPGSPDAKVNEICFSRYSHALQIAEQLNARVVIFHANFIAAIHNDDYRQGWQQRNIVFWSRMAEVARQHNVTIAVENMWEFDPNIIGDVLRAVDHPYLRACIDVGHAHLFSRVPFETWLQVMEPWLIHTHLNNNNGVIDIHHAFIDGVLDYTQILRTLRALPNPPPYTLEMDHVEDMRVSLPYFELTREGLKE
jgi:sugar phosphate isomerase/epimerase